MKKYDFETSTERLALIHALCGMEWTGERQEKIDFPDLIKKYRAAHPNEQAR